MMAAARESTLRSGPPFLMRQVLLAQLHERNEARLPSEEAAPKPLLCGREGTFLTRQARLRELRDVCAADDSSDEEGDGLGASAAVSFGWSLGRRIRLASAHADDAE